MGHFLTEGWTLELFDFFYLYIIYVIIICMKEFTLEVEQQKNTRDILNVSDIPDDVITKHPDLFVGCDFSKKGLAIFPNNESRINWIKFCLQKFHEGQIEPETCFRSLNEALDDSVGLSGVNIKKNNFNSVLPDDISYRYNELGRFSSEAGKVISEYIYKLYKDDGRSELVMIFKEIPLSLELFNELDEKLVDNTKKENLIFWLGYIKSHEASLLFPKTISRAKEMLSSAVKKDLDLADYFIENLACYVGESQWLGKAVINSMGHYSLAKKFIDTVEYGVYWVNLPWVNKALEIAKSTVQEHENKDKEGLKENDPYENNPWRFTAEQAKKAVILAQIFEGNVDEEKALELGIDIDVIRQVIKYLDDTITVEVFDDTKKEDIRNNPRLSDEDKDSIIKSEVDTVRFKPLISVIRSLIARYLVQELGDIKILEDDKKLRDFLLKNNDEIRQLYPDSDYDGPGKDLLDHLVRNRGHEGLRKFITALEVDVPLYDKLYEEFDNLRETGRLPLEVYLGRDGIYAWIGRRAQDVARRRKLGLEGRREQKEKGEIIEIHPQYLVYPRYFRDNINYETKRKFLEQEGISPDADPLFYDTGYTGTIPEQIMKIMEFDEDQVEQRIRLLSAPSKHRRVKGISDNAREEIIEYIEHNSKTEEAAEGLILDEGTGKIRHIAKPTSPEEQFYFNMVKQAISRHYWLREKLHHEPSGNVNLDSEHYAIRIREDYAKLLPPEFLHDPKTYFIEHGELLKGSRGEGEYPDEEIVLFRLNDGTEIVAKKIELRKAKEARKEFSILISAKKAGLPTAEPVGFLSGKEEIDGSYLLMKKIEGRSGRKFEKELRQSGKYTEEKISEIMEVVAEKNREMAELFRTTLKIDKNWKIKDTIIEFNEETGEVGSVIPIDWERAKEYNPNSPQEIN